MLFFTPSAISLVKAFTATLSLSQVAPVNFDRSCFRIRGRNESEGKALEGLVVVEGFVEEALGKEEEDEGEGGVGDVAKLDIFNLWLEKVFEDAVE